MTFELGRQRWINRFSKRNKRRKHVSQSSEVGESTGLRGRRLLLVMTTMMGDSTPSGGDVLIQEFVESFISHEVEITVLAAESSRAHLRSEFQERIIPIRGNISNSSSVALAYLARSFKILCAPRHALVDQRPDIVVTGSVFLPDLVAAYIFARRAEVWVLSWLLEILPPNREYFKRHSIEGMQKLRQGIRTSLSFACQELALALARRRRALVIVPSQELQNRAIARGFLKSDVLVCRTTLDRPLNRPVSQNENRRTDFLFMGRFHAQKGLRDLLIAWDAIHAELPNVRLRVVGGGEGSLASRFLDELARRADSIEYLGIVGGEVKWDLLEDTRVLLFPSTYESLGIVVLDAFAAGAVVVGYEISSTTEAFSEGVIQVPLSEPLLLAHAAIEVFQDQVMWRNQQQKGYQMLERYLSRDSPESAAVKILEYSKKLPE